MMEIVCPACRNTALESRDLKSRTGVIIPISFCTNCGHGIQFKNDNYDIYSSGEFSEFARDKAKVPTAAKVKELDKKAFRRFKFYNKFLKPAKNALEVGSSIGSFVHLMKLSGRNCEGIEPDPEYAEFSQQQYGFSQKSVLLENFTTEKTYDLVYSFHVIEHVPNPEAYVHKAYTLLNPNGKILIECPSWDLHSFGNVEFTIWEPHLQYFTLSSIYSLLSRNSFKVIEIGFIGSALYAVAKKTKTPTFQNQQFRRYHKKYKRAFWFNQNFPKIPLSIKGTRISDLILQYSFSKNNRTAREIISLGAFAIQNSIYLRKEKGQSPKASHVSYYSGWENAGDTVLSKCVRDSLNFCNGWNLIKITDPVDDNVVTQINNSKHLVLGGGGVLLPDSNPNTISGWQWAINADYWKEIKVPVIVFAIGYNFFKGQKNTEIFKSNLIKLVERADFFSLRNRGSINKVKEIIPVELHAKIHFQPCPTTIIRSLYPNLPAKKTTKKVGINIAFDRYERRYGQDIYLILDQIALAMKSIQNAGYEIINVCHLENDSKFDISLEHRKVVFETVNLQYKLPNDVYHFYNELEVMIGTRGHAQMIPFGLNTKIISLGSHDKLRYFLEDINSLDWYLDVHGSPQKLSENLINKFNHVIESEANITSRLQNEQKKLFEITKENLRTIYQLVD